MTKINLPPVVSSFINGARELDPRDESKAYKAGAFTHRLVKQAQHVSGAALEAIKNTIGQSIKAFQSGSSNLSTALSGLKGTLSKTTSDILPLSDQKTVSDNLQKLNAQNSLFNQHTQAANPSRETQSLFTVVAEAMLNKNEPAANEAIKNALQNSQDKLALEANLRALADSVANINKSIENEINKHTSLNEAIQNTKGFHGTNTAQQAIENLNEFKTILSFLQSNINTQILQDEY